MEHLRSGPRLATEGFKCKTQATGGWQAPSGHSRVLFDTVKLCFVAQHDNVLAHWGPPGNQNFHQIFTPGTPQAPLEGGGGTNIRTDGQTDTYSYIMYDIYK